MDPPLTRADRASLTHPAPLTPGILSFTTQHHLPALYTLPPPTILLPPSAQNTLLNSTPTAAAHLIRSLPPTWTHLAMPLQHKADRRWSVLLIHRQPNTHTFLGMLYDTRIAFMHPETGQQCETGWNSSLAAAVSRRILRHADGNKGQTIDYNICSGVPQVHASESGVVACVVLRGIAETLSTAPRQGDLDSALFVFDEQFVKSRLVEERDKLKRAVHEVASESLLVLVLCAAGVAVGVGALPVLQTLLWGW
ncbi:hypothetical protein P153DRAFT_391185 [Dothidotthia symphoricarpi CBS 119687]|uniref:Uncharacterized protein n=1 Tax=Dothidotthia symphoricarpi CBS 119687 TaxID=1392245 RepID=A0A6A5ZZC4_9PLEO|nr:uncharacterized protein P153DRAFT_391185 [Dothidotthia symphoricarpi CBS 119687]KAF2123768.1 hypothetical protein P153DRAFT_391185 [Dothidotthia symphoricarpi CBS 119687]